MPLGRFLRHRQLWAFRAGKFLTDPIWWFYLYWLRKLFNTRYHVSRLHLGLPLVTVYNASAIGSIGGGWLPGMLHRHGFSMARRFSAMFLCACLVLPVLFANLPPSLWYAVALLSVAAAGHQGWSAKLLTIPSDLFPKKAVASVVGIGGTWRSALCYRNGMDTSSHAPLHAAVLHRGKRVPDCMADPVLDRAEAHSY
jgi:ACS family hexuronate transporter-like MFS transporter